MTRSRIKSYIELEINVLAGQLLAEKASRNNVKQFIFASSGSVYGIKDEERVTEDLNWFQYLYITKQNGRRKNFFILRDKFQVHCTDLQQFAVFLQE